jgi:hypothetical protein
LRIALLLIVVIAMACLELYALRGHARSAYNPDELIPAQVIAHMQATGTLDTDWAHAQFPPYLRDYLKVHYNFSGYIIASWSYIRLLQPDALSSQIATIGALQLFSHLCDVMLTLIVLFFTRRWWGNFYATLAAIGVFIEPTLFQDAHYARPEALGSLLFTTCFFIAAAVERSALPRRAVTGLFATAFITGFLASIKITYLASGLFCLVPLATTAKDMTPRHARRIAAYLAGAALLMIAGFALGAPGAVGRPMVYMEGLHALTTQYAHLHPPFSLADYSFTGQVAWIWGYFAATMGILILIAHPFGYLCRDIPRLTARVFLAMMIFTTLLFIHQHVFFERNFSHLLPAFVIIAIGGLRVISATAARRVGTGRMAGILVTALFAVSQVNAFDVSRSLWKEFKSVTWQKHQAQREAAADAAASRIGARKIIDVGYSDVFDNRVPPDNDCVLYKVVDYDDDWSRRFLASHASTFAQAGTLPSAFSHVPTSTLWTYHSPTVHLMYNPGRCKR